MRTEPKTRADKEREKQFTLRAGESWHNGARVRRTPVAKLVNPRKPK